MAQEISCGILVIRKRPAQREILLIQSRQGGHWSFPKGHMEPGETELDTARREVREETGLLVEPLPDLRGTVAYRLPNGREKTVIYFGGLLSPDSAEPHPQQEEIAALQWASLDEAASLLTYANDRALLASLHPRLICL